MTQNPRFHFCFEGSYGTDLRVLEMLRIKNLPPSAGFQPANHESTKGHHGRHVLGPTCLFKDKFILVWCRNFHQDVFFQLRFDLIISLQT